MKHEPATPRESQLRSLLKAITYRIMGSLTTVGVTFMVTGEAAVALAIGSIEPVVKLLGYYAHERVWQRVPVGTIRRLAHLLPAAGRVGYRSSVSPNDDGRSDRGQTARAGIMTTRGANVTDKTPERMGTRRAS